MGDTKDEGFFLVNLVEWKARGIMTVEELVTMVEEEVIAVSVGGATAAVEEDYNERDNEGHDWERSMQIRMYYHTKSA